MNAAKHFPKTFILFYLFHISIISMDTITSNLGLKDGDVLVSSGKNFALGFFSPNNSMKRYVGIWYNEIPEQTVVWVANRDNPVGDTSGVLSVSTRGNLVLYGRNQTVPVWHANASDTSPRNCVAQLLDSGNLVLVRNDTGETLWQSFDYPTDTLLPSMKIGLDKRTALNRILASWKSWDDPGTGICSFRVELAGFPQLFLYKGRSKWWRVGSWTGQKWTGLPEMRKHYIINSTFIDNEDEVSITYGVIDPSMLTRIIVDDPGSEQRLTWSTQEQRWIGYSSYPKELCDHYGHCGSNSNCNPYGLDEYECTCLPGFMPKYPADWYLKDGSAGCVRKPQMSACQRGDGFVRVERTKVPDTSVARVKKSMGLKECEDMRLRDCSCLAYTSAYADTNQGVGCLTYYGDMMDTRTFMNAGQDLYVRVDEVELALHRKNGSPSKKKIETIVILSFIATLLMLAAVCCSFKGKRLMESATSSSECSFLFTASLRSSYRDTSFESGYQKEGSRRNSEFLPVYDLSTIAAATNDFSSNNKLGEGGFGSVYKGVLHDGNEIAVKRLSRFSGQGIEEFKTEVTLIAQLQHRNLVSIIGCCIEAQEKMLIYEFLPNKSLDIFIFDESRRTLLDWSKRFEIICGIARGILYLHQDSRLRIIHRDLKASNILLDAALNPKISDFGMARIFGGDQMEGNTNRVMGTFGYMAPEYAMEGLFSTKSDVYSFGVLLLEIISGRKNKEGWGSSNLAGHIWDLWKEGKTREIVDKSLGESCLAPDVLRCIHIGLLCVQEQAMDRPTMSTVVFMLGNDNAPPPPKHPAFIPKRISNVEDLWINEGVSSSLNKMSITAFQPR